MLPDESALPPEIPDRASDRRAQWGESWESLNIWLAGAIVALVLLLIFVGTLISLIVPPVGQVKVGATGTEGQTIAAGDGKEVQATQDHAELASQDEAVASSPAEISPVATDGEPTSERSQAEEGVENSLSEQSENNQKAVPELSEMDQEVADDAKEKEVIEPFVINLPKARRLDDSQPPANSIIEKGALRERAAKSRLEKLESYGGTEESELAVAAALDWLARHQLPSGAWSFDHSPSCDGTCQNRSVIVDAQRDPQLLANAATGLSLLPFLGAGFTHRDGKYREVVDKGIRYLLKSQQKELAGFRGGSWIEFTGFMYSHGIASMAICEAYAMTEDPQLRPAAQAAVNFIAEAQHTQGGGWRYQPREQGDMSMLGWQLMALKSGELGGLAVNKQCFRGAEYFIDSLRVPRNGAYGYSAPMADGDDTCTTAIGALGLYYLGRDNDSQEQQASVKFLIQNGPVLDDLYGLYYSTQAVMHLGGDDWPAWNEKVREHLIRSQEKSGHAKGSWFVSGHGTHATGGIGGRLYCTAMSAMILEVYYRHLPLYAKKKR